MMVRLLPQTLLGAPLVFGLVVLGCGGGSTEPKDASPPQNGAAGQGGPQARPVGGQAPQRAGGPRAAGTPPRPGPGATPPTGGALDPNAPPQLSLSDPSPGSGSNPYTDGANAGSPTNVLQQGSLQHPPAKQPDPGPAPASPNPDTTGCDSGMVRVETADGALCVHQYEVSVQLKEFREGMIRQFIHQPDLLKLVSAPGQYPSIVSWNEAAHLCRHNGYRLCTSKEWEDICDGVPGEGGGKFSVIENPSEYVPGACVFTHTQHGGMVPLQRTGTKPWCVTPSGVYDLLGNVWEWTNPEVPPKDGRPVTDKRGGAHYSRGLSSCTYPSVGTHGPDWLGSVGFRCCTEPR